MTLVMFQVQFISMQIRMNNKETEKIFFDTTKS